MTIINVESTPNEIVAKMIGYIESGAV